jgi:hypothetical protein
MATIYPEDLYDRIPWIWIDTICINQSDMVEKSSAVSHMKETYGNAQVVVCWLGPVGNTFDNNAISNMFRRCLDIHIHDPSLGLGTEQ